MCLCEEYWFQKTFADYSKPSVYLSLTSPLMSNITFKKFLGSAVSLNDNSNRPLCCNVPPEKFFNERLETNARASCLFAQLWLLGKGRHVPIQHNNLFKYWATDRKKCRSASKRTSKHESPFMALILSNVLLMCDFIHVVQIGFHLHIKKVSHLCVFPSYIFPQVTTGWIARRVWRRNSVNILMPHVGV